MNSRRYFTSFSNFINGGELIKDLLELTKREEVYRHDE
jgi:hypothetical protein